VIVNSAVRIPDGGANDNGVQVGAGLDAKGVGEMPQFSSSPYKGKYLNTTAFLRTKDLTHLVQAYFEFELDIVKLIGWAVLRTTKKLPIAIVVLLLFFPVYFFLRD